MKHEQIIEIQKAVGAEPDGFWGPKSIAAVQAHLLALMPEENPWPRTDQESLTEFYGAPCNESRLVSIECPAGIYYEGRQVKTILCHARVAESLKRILYELVHHFPEVATRFAGCFNCRSMRGGSTPSLHARGAAIDFDPDNNGNHTSWPVAATMPLGVMEIFAREGWKAAGAFWGRDAMHFQATR